MKINYQSPYYMISYREHRHEMGSTVVWTAVLSNIILETIHYHSTHCTASATNPMKDYCHLIRQQQKHTAETLRSHVTEVPGQT